MSNFISIEKLAFLILALVGCWGECYGTRTRAIFGVVARPWETRKNAVCGKIVRQAQ
jgi:hypothetical protein